MSTWEAELPLRDRYRLSEAAAADLVRLAPGTEVTFGYPSVEQRRAGETRPEAPIGECTSAFVARNGRVKAILELRDATDEAAAVALGMLRDGACGVGLDATVAVSHTTAPITIERMKGLRALSVVPMDAEPQDRWSGGDGG